MAQKRAKTNDKADARRVDLLDAAAAVFLRFGYRKSSMDDVATAAGVSRQALYLRFASKDELFRAAVEHVLASSLANARARLAEQGELEPRIVTAYAALHGAHLGAHRGAHRGDRAPVQNMAELVEAAASVIGPGVHTVHEPFIDDVARLLAREQIAGARDKPSARDLAATLDAASRGIKHEAESLADYQRQMARVVRVVCRPNRAKEQKR